MSSVEFKMGIYYSGEEIPYVNGNYFVRPLRNGGLEKRTLRVGEDFKPEFPDSIDLKITNSCKWGCSFCHESSVSGGPSFNLERTKEVLSKLPPVAIEIAIGGGSVFDAFPEYLDLVGWLKERGNRVRTTINWNDVKANRKEIKDYLEDCSYLFKHDDISNEACQLLETLGRHNVGVSMTKYYKNNPFKIRAGSLDKMSHPVANPVYHVIVGVLPLEDLEKMVKDQNNYYKILVLGFKQFGRASGMKVRYLEEWKKSIAKILYDIRNFKGGKELSIAFDNLALEQLGVRGMLTKEEWDMTYMGKEFSCSMYVDAVNETFAPSSTSLNRVSWNSTDILTYFKNAHN